MRTNDPVHDAEAYQIECGDRKYIHCEHCGEKIYQSDDLYEGDYYYDICGMSICEQCIDDFKKECVG